MKYFFRTVMLKTCFTDAMTKYWLVTECSLNKDRIVKWWMNSPRIYLSINSSDKTVVWYKWWVELVNSGKTNDC